MPTGVLKLIASRFHYGPLFNTICTKCIFILNYNKLIVRNQADYSERHIAMSRSVVSELTIMVLQLKSYRVEIKLVRVVSIIAE